MPSYDYKCEACNHEWELFQSMNDSPVKRCPKCKKQKAKRLLGLGAGLIFKGTGFYETDYKKKTGGEKTESSSESKSSESGGSEKPSPSKETKKESKPKKEKVKAA